jgi:hypothetical protein
MIVVRKIVSFMLLVSALTIGSTGFAQLPPIMNPPNAQWYLWTCSGKSTLGGQEAICGQAYGYNDYWARNACGSTFYEIRCWPSGI